MYSIPKTTSDPTCSKLIAAPLFLPKNKSSLGFRVNAAKNRANCEAICEEMFHKEPTLILSHHTFSKLRACTPSVYTYRGPLNTLFSKTFFLENKEKCNSSKITLSMKTLPKIDVNLIFNSMGVSFSEWEDISKIHSEMSRFFQKDLIFTGVNTNNDLSTQKVEHLLKRCVDLGRKPCEQIDNQEKKIFSELLEALKQRLKSDLLGKNLSSGNFHAARLQLCFFKLLLDDGKLPITDRQQFLRIVKQYGAKLDAEEVQDKITLASLQSIEAALDFFLRLSLNRMNLSEKEFTHVLKDKIQSKIFFESYDPLQSIVQCVKRNWPTLFCEKKNRLLQHRCLQIAVSQKEQKSHEQILYRITSLEATKPLVSLLLELNFDESKKKSEQISLSVKEVEIYAPSFDLHRKTMESKQLLLSQRGSVCLSQSTQSVLSELSANLDDETSLSTQNVSEEPQYVMQILKEILEPVQSLKKEGT